MKLIELIKIINDTEQLFAFLITRRLIKQYTSCPECNSTLYLCKSRKIRGIGKIYKCPSRNCLKSVSIWESSIFKKFNILASDLLYILYLKSLKIDHVEISSQTNISRPVIININKLLLSKVEINYIPSLIGGGDNWVEIDETHIVSRRDGRGRIMTGERYWIIGAKSRIDKKISLKVVRNRNKRICKDFIINNIIQNSTIITDCWRGYIDIHELGYTHYTINHNEHFVDRENPIIHTNSIESIWSVYKRKLPNYKTFEDLEKYTKIFQFEWNLNMKNAEGRFDKYIEICNFNNN